jgi:hypothetical protein
MLDLDPDSMSPDPKHWLDVITLDRFGEMYKNAIVEYKTNYFKERSAFSLFTRYMIGRGQDFISLYFF